MGQLDFFLERHVISEPGRIGAAVPVQVFAFRREGGGAIYGFFYQGALAADRFHQIEVAGAAAFPGGLYGVGGGVHTQYDGGIPFFACAGLGQVQAAQGDDFSGGGVEDAEVGTPFVLVELHFLLWVDAGIAVIPHFDLYDFLFQGGGILEYGRRGDTEKQFASVFRKLQRGIFADEPVFGHESGAGGGSEAGGIYPSFPVVQGPGADLCFCRVEVCHESGLCATAV